MKSYDEMVESLFERRKLYIAEQKRRKKLLISSISTICCMCLIASLSFGLSMWEKNRHDILDKNLDEQMERDEQIRLETNNSYIADYACIYPEKSIEELVLESELVVRAKFVDTMPSERRNDLVVTDHIFEILETYSGDKKAGDKITVERLGGILDDNKYEVAGDNRELQTGEEVILILSYPKKANDEICSTDYYAYYPLGGIYFKNDQASAKDEEQFVALDSSTLNLSTIQAQINDIYAASKAELE